MEIEERRKLETATEDLIMWSERLSKARLAFGQAKYELGLIVASKAQNERSSFENKVLTLLSDDNDKYLAELWKSYVMEEQKYKAAERVCSAKEAMINTIKYINRVIV